MGMSGQDLINSQAFTKDEIEMLDLIDRCYQISSNDRLLIRKYFKSRDPFICQILFENRKQKSENLNKLQILLRKYVKHVKSNKNSEYLYRPHNQEISASSPNMAVYQTPTSPVISSRPKIQHFYKQSPPKNFYTAHALSPSRYQTDDIAFNKAKLIDIQIQQSQNRIKEILEQGPLSLDSEQNKIDYTSNMNNYVQNKKNANEYVQFKTDYSQNKSESPQNKIASIETDYQFKQSSEQNQKTEDLTSSAKVQSRESIFSNFAVMEELQKRSAEKPKYETRESIFTDFQELENRLQKRLSQIGPDLKYIQGRFVPEKKKSNQSSAEKFKPNMTMSPEKDSNDQRVFRSESLQDHKFTYQQEGRMKTNSVIQTYASRLSTYQPHNEDKQSNFKPRISIDEFLRMSNKKYDDQLYTSNVDSVSNSQLSQQQFQLPVDNYIGEYSSPVSLLNNNYLKEKELKANQKNESYQSTILDQAPKYINENYKNFLPHPIMKIKSNNIQIFAQYFIMFVQIENCDLKNPFKLL